MHLAADGAVRSSLNIWKTVERLFVRLNSGRDLLPGTRAHNHHHAHDLNPLIRSFDRGKHLADRCQGLSNTTSACLWNMFSFAHRGHETLRACIDRVACAQAA
jgi:hypothetical protein